MINTATPAQINDPTVLAALHDELYPVVYRYVRYRLDDPHIVEDISSEVFLRLLDALRKNPGGINNLRAWLLGTASHLVSDHLRRQYSRREEDLEARERPDGFSTEDVVDESWRKQQVRRAMRQLTSEQQHVLALRFAEDRSIEETAALMGKSVGAVKTLQFRAVAALKSLLEGKQKR